MRTKMVEKNYKDYIIQHRQGVINTWEDILRPVILEEVHVSSSLSSYIVKKIDDLVVRHDENKLLYSEEYIPYSNHYMHPEEFPKNTDAYRRGWLHHQKNSPHHWQYWVVMEDIEDPKFYALEMDFEYVIEMLCDWQSASNYYGNTAHWWYDTQKNNMILHPATRELVKKYLKYLD